MKEDSKSLSGYKYRLHYYLRRMSVNDYEIAMKHIPELLKISSKTWERWIFLPIDSNYDISFLDQVRIASFLQVKPFELFAPEIQEEYSDLVKK